MMKTRDILLVGSLPLEDTGSVIDAVADTLGDDIVRIPDGETGDRSKFVTWQGAVLGAAEQFESGELGPQEEWGPNGEFPPRIIKLKPGATGTPEFGPTGYAEEALKSWAVFKDRLAAGKISAGTRFQVGLPTPIGVLYIFMEPDGQELAEPVYTARMTKDLDRICREIPGENLTIQWDVPTEIAIWEDLQPTFLDDPHRDCVDRLVALMNRVPAEAELGMHLCYGDIAHKHWKEPDLGLMARFTNAVLAGLDRRLDYVHMPVPAGWTSPDHYAALRDFDLPAETTMHLGLVHHTDGVEGARRRIEAASVHRADFGVATSCGMGRREPADLPDILRLHADIAKIQ